MKTQELNRSGAFFHSGAHEEADVVTHGVCLGCGLCAMVCPTHALTMGGLHPTVRYYQKNPTLQPSLCIHCGRCAGVCPSGTLHQARLDHMLRTVRDTAPHTAVFLCRNLFLLASPALDAGTVPPTMSMGEAYMSPQLDDVAVPPGVFFATVRCAGRLGARFLDRLVLSGVRNLLIFACPPRQCAYDSGKDPVSAHALGLADVYAAYDIPVRIEVDQGTPASPAAVEERLRRFIAERPAD